MKLALRYIPTEVWVDVICYPWITRKKLGKIVHKFRNRYFAEILQYCLHDRGKQMLGNLQFKEDGIYKCLESEPNAEKLDVAQTPMPENIKLFQMIEIKHFDSSTLDFLRQISTLFITNDVNLRFGLGPADDLANLCFVLDHLCPLLHGIRSLAFHHSAITLMEQYFGQKLAQLKMLVLNLGTAPADPATAQAINFCIDWLISDKRDCAEPRLLVVRTRSENFQQFSTAIQQQFRSAKSACTFAFAITDFDRRNNNNNRIAEFHLLENNLGEQLHGKCKPNDNSIFQIVRLQPSAFTALQEWINKVSAEQGNKTNAIEFLHNVTTGQIGANADADEVHDDGGVEADPHLDKQ